MLVHVFGATSSPSCAVFCLAQTAEQLGVESNSTTSEVIKNFNDRLTSCDLTDEIITFVKHLRELLKLGGFRLTKSTFTSKPVFDSIPEHNKAKTMFNFDLCEPLKKRVLGGSWNVTTMTFGIS